ncbi:glycosyltransferase family 4 protein [Nostocaceae cyanobacterium CENA357]|uniref:Glycosyltransferase family 4 protein n=1 Tax=Atlanticothrix silvestris CENA357 TaxID=1725252 RepID=A0A8J7HGU7_9CYAN|nr:glycosyltransferase family 1 protein [Atlanticothrix silvestris]MBH8552385.1 glycosyltransferase family 4 protein [Atlanticothrix silvestris CENA357]
MKILINCISLLSGSQGAGGAGKYLYALVVGLARVATVRVLVQPHNFFLFKQISGIQVIPLVDNASSAIHENMSWSDVYLCPLNELLPHYIDSRVPVVSCIHDLQHEIYPHFFKDGFYEARRKYYGYAISRSDAILTMCNHEKSLIEKIYSKKEVYVTYESGYLADEFSHKLDNIINNQNFNVLEDPYIIYPAIPWRHKNHYRLVESLWILKREYPQFDKLKLILTGAQQHDLKSTSLERIIDDLEMQKSVEIRGFVSDIELAILIKNAKFMIFPSLYEGFGIPLVDAMKFGTPVLTTSIASIPEICGNAVAYLNNPFNSKTMAHDIAKLLMDEDKLLHLSDLGKQQGFKYSLQKTAEITFQALEEVVNKHRAKQSLDFISARSATTCNKGITKRLTLLLDFVAQNEVNEQDIQESLNMVSEMFQFHQDTYKFINILPFNSQVPEFDNLVSKTNTTNLYSDITNKSHYLNLFGYIIDAVVATDYMMYCPSITGIQKLDILQAIATLDVCDHLTAVSFSDQVDYPTEVRPFKGAKLLKQFNSWKTRQLDFFSFKIIRVRSQNYNEHLGTFQFLSNFLSYATYVNYPIRKI